MSDSLVDLVFESVVDDDAFAALPAEVARRGGFLSVGMALQSAGGSTFVGEHGFEPGYTAAYDAYFWRRDLWRQAFEAHHASGVMSTDALVKESEFLRSEIYNDLMRPAGDIYRALGFVAQVHPGEQLVVAGQRARRQPSFEPETQDALGRLRPLLTHLMRARQRAAAAPFRIAKALLDHEADAVFVVSRHGWPAFANAAARRLQDGPVGLRQGRLLPTSPADGAALTRAISWACMGRGGGVVPPQKHWVGRFAVVVDELPAHPGLACVRVRDLAARSAAALRAARRRYHLTHAEVGVAGSLLDGQTAGAHAIARGVSLATVRTQIRSLFDKVGVRRQVELVKELRACAPN